MTRVRRKWLAWLTFWTIRYSPNRGGRRDLAQRLRRMDFETSTRRLGVRMNERLRDRLRRKWLRLHK